MSDPSVTSDVTGPGATNLILTVKIAEPASEITNPLRIFTSLTKRLKIF